MSTAAEGAVPTPSFEAGTLRGRARQVVRAILRGIFRVSIGMRLVGVERVPAQGGLLVVANHLHNADPVLISVAFPRPLHYMTKKEAFSPFIFRAVLRSGGAFPVDRGKADRSAIRAAQQRLLQGIAVGMFPEGTRSETRALREAHAGAGLLALSAGSPVLPIAITGTERLPLNGQKGRLQSERPMPDPGHRGVRVLFGDLFRIPREIDGRRVTSDEATEIIMVELARLLPPDYRGAYADAFASETVRRAVPVSAQITAHDPS